MLFSGVFSQSFVAYDDLSYVVQNPFVNGGLSVEGCRWAFTALNGGVSYWHPLTWISYQMDVELYGQDCTGHKLTNLLLHFYNVVLVYCLLRRLSHSVFICFTVAGVFLCHPLHVESIVWVSERKDLLCAFFELLGFHSYLSYYEARSWKRFGAVCFWFACALMSKPMAVTFPCLILLLEFWLRQTREQRTSFRSLLWGNVLLFAMSFGISALTLVAQDELAVVPGLDELPLSYRIANALTSYWVYSVKVIVPLGLAVHYPYPLSFDPWLVWTGLCFFCFMSAWALVSWRSEPILSFGWGWFVIGLLPVIGLIQTSDQARADRYMYLPLLGLVLPAASLLNRWRGRLPRGTGESLVVFVVAVFSWMTWHQVGYWKDSESLFRRALEVTKDNAVMHLGLARSLDWVRESNEVLVHLQAAMAIEPENPEIYIDLARYYRYRGHQRLEQIHLEKAAFWKAAKPSHLYRLD